MVWIHIPKSHIQENLETQVSLNGRTYKIDRSERLFVKDELPKVNDTVFLNQDIASTQLPSCLPLNQCTEEELERWSVIQETDKNKPFIYNKEIAKINTEPYQCTYASGKRGCWDLNKGAKLEILALNSFDNILFALVRVVNC